MPARSLSLSFFLSLCLVLCMCILCNIVVTYYQLCMCHIHTLSMWVAARSVLNGQIDCQNMSWLHCFESCDHFQDPTRSGDADVVCVTSTMSAVEDTRRWRGATFLFHQLGKMKLQATSISYTVATGQKFMVWCWNARMVIRHIDYIYYFTKVIKSTIGFHYAYWRLVVILEMFDSAEGSYWMRHSHGWF